MNRFFTKQKKEDESSASSGSFGKKSKKNKKGQVEQKPELDLGTFLPSNDEFRTSLIMPNLSARFSMLKEQDDPKSKLGKASDDSVLGANRQSRLNGLNDFGFKSSTLADIDEVSINGSIRPPFLRERQGSMETFRTGSEDTDGSGSIMSRARPGEGNILFGGRQKIYKITGSGSSRGRALYEDDVSVSTFQRLRREEKVRQEQEQQEKYDSSTSRDEALSALSGYNQRRETSSSTHSGARTSTAATSVTSQGSAPAAPSSQGQASIDRSVIKTRRLYEQGLDQHMHEQQTTQLNRLNTVHRHRGGTGSGTSSPTAITQVRSASSLSDRFNRPNDGPRTVSPPPSSTYNNFPLNSKPMPSNASSPPFGKMQTPPISPVQSDKEELSNAINPNDRGKATALGAFNKPQAFSEEQYLQRQMHLQQGRETPTMRQSDEESSDERDESTTQESPSAFNVFQSAASQMRSPGAPSAQSQNSSNGNRTFFASSAGDDADLDSLRSPPHQNTGRPSPSSNLVAPPLHEHPALRSQRSEQDLKDRTDSGNDFNRVSSAQAASAFLQVDETAKPQLDSPTLGTENAGLSGLVRQHLRNVSNVSSNYSDDMPPAPTSMDMYNRISNSDRSYMQSESATPAQSSHGHSNPWDREDSDRAETESVSSVSPVEPQVQKDRTPGRKLTLEEMESRAFEIQQEAEARRAAWELEMMTKHSRQPSAEERDAFQQELAMRQKAIAERMRQAEDSQQISSTRRALGMLRSKSSRDSVASGNAPNKLKMLGFGGSSTSVNKMGRDNSRADDERQAMRSRGSSHSRSRYGARDVDSHGAGRDVSRERSRPPYERSSPTSHSSIRNRSSSDISSGRSRSRPARGDRRVIDEASSNSTTPDATSGADRSRSNSKSTANSQVSEQSLYPQTGLQSRFSPAPASGPGNLVHRPSAAAQSGPMSLQRPIQTGYAASATPPLSAVNPTVPGFNGERGPVRRRTVNKQDISEPVLLSSTSVQETVDLPPGASLKNGQDMIPPLPPMNPRRRFGFGRSNPSSPVTSPPNGTPTNENEPPFLQARTYSGDDAEKLRRHRQKLRKTSSDGHGLYNRTQIPDYPVTTPPSPPRAVR